MRAIDIDLAKHELATWARVMRREYCGNLGYPNRAAFTALRVDGHRGGDKITHDQYDASCAERVTAALEQLAERERLAVARRYVFGYSFQKIAGEIGLSSRHGARDVVERAQVRLAYLLADQERPARCAVR